MPYWWCGWRLPGCWLALLSWFLLGTAFGLQLLTDTPALLKAVHPINQLIVDQPIFGLLLLPPCWGAWPLARQVHRLLGGQHPLVAAHVGLHSAILQLINHQHRQITPPETQRALHLIGKENELASHCWPQNQ